jgi:hypothetical protein
LVPVEVDRLCQSIVVSVLITFISQLLTYIFCVLFCSQNRHQTCSFFQPFTSWLEVDRDVWTLSDNFPMTLIPVSKTPPTDLQLDPVNLSPSVRRDGTKFFTTAAFIDLRHAFFQPETTIIWFFLFRLTASSTVKSRNNSSKKKIFHAFNSTVKWQIRFDLRVGIICAFSRVASTTKKSFLLPTTGLELIFPTSAFHLDRKRFQVTLKLLMFCSISPTVLSRGSTLLVAMSTDKMMSGWTKRLVAIFIYFRLD